MEIADNITTEEQESEEHSENHLQFIQAIIQLKASLKLGNSLPLNEFKDIICSFPSECKEISAFESLISDTPCSSYQMILSEEACDSGIGSSLDNSSCDFISTSSISYFIQSPLVAKHLYDSVIYVLNYLFTSLINTSEENLQQCIQNWRGSLMENAILVIVDLMDSISSNEDNDYSKSCSEFVKKLIEMIFFNKDEKSYSSLENLCVIVNELCKNYYLCQFAINCIMKIIDDDSAKLKTNSLCSQSVLDIDKTAIALPQYDTLCFVMNLLENLLQKWCKQSSLLTQEKGHANTPYSDISEIWKRSWKMSQTNVDPKNVIKSVQNKWSIILENTIQMTMDKHPNYSFLLWSCLKTLENVTIS